MLSKIAGLGYDASLFGMHSFLQQLMQEYGTGYSKDTGGGVQRQPKTVM